MSELPRIVALSAVPDSSLGAALESALAKKGWFVDSLPDTPSRSHHALTSIVVVLEDDHGTTMPIHTLTKRIPSRRWVCIGSLRSSAQLAVLARLGASVLNQELPFLVLLAQVEEVLAGTAAQGSRAGAAAAVEQRAAEAQAVGRLTDRERAVLCSLVHGMNVQQIAQDGPRSLATVRSQVQSMLRRLGVRSQVEAVTIGHRSGSHMGLGHCLESLHQF